MKVSWCSVLIADCLLLTFFSRSRWTNKPTDTACRNQLCISAPEMPAATFACHLKGYQIELLERKLCRAGRHLKSPKVR